MNEDLSALLMKLTEEGYAVSLGTTNYDNWACKLTRLKYAFEGSPSIYPHQAVINAIDELDNKGMLS